MPDKQRFLVAYDYGQGGLWAYVLAPSEKALRDKHPELEIVTEPPPWMDSRRQNDLEVIDIAQPEGTWLAIPPGARQAPSS